MKKLTLILSSILMVQVLLAIILFAYKGDYGTFQSDQLLLDLKPDAFDSISLEQQGKPALLLKMDKNTWQLPGYFNVPAASDKVDELNRKLLALKTGWPVANTEEAAGRFHVNQGKFERKIIFQKESKAVKTLYLGTSPSFKKIHARVDGQKDIHVIDFSSFEASISPEDWLKTDLVKIEPDQLSHIKASDFTLSKTGQDWMIDGLEAGKTANTAEIKGFLNKLSGLVVSGVLGIEDKPEYHLQTPVLSLSLKKQDQELQYQFGKQEGTADYVLKVSTLPYYFKISQALVDPLKEVKLEKLAATTPVSTQTNQSKTSTKPSGSR